MLHQNQIETLETDRPELNSGTSEGMETGYLN